MYSSLFMRFGEQELKPAISLIKIQAFFFLAISAVLLSAGHAYATPGKVNEAGCHNNKKIGYHCHAERLPKTSSSESVRDRDHRLKRECRGRTNAGLCLGYGN